MPTVKDYAATWIAQRRALQAVGYHRSLKDDEQRLRDHILPFVPEPLVGIAIGDLPVSAVRPSHVKALIHHLIADLLVPSRQHHGEPRCIKHEQREFRRDMERLGLRVRRGHDARRTFISLALADGARRDILRFVTHGARGRQAFDLYEQYPWADLCAEVAKLRFGGEPPVAPGPGPTTEPISVALEGEPR